MFDAIRILQLSWVNGVSLFFSLSGDPFFHQFQVSKNLIQDKNIKFSSRKQKNISYYNYKL